MNPTLEVLSRIQDDVSWSLQQLQQADLFIAGVTVLGTMLLLQLWLAVWTIRRLGELGHMRERLSRLFDGLALLTDTTETGLSAVAQQIQRVGPKRPTTRTSRSKVTRRVVEAARAGRPVADIARDESLSEGEVHLHLKLAEAARHSAPEVAA